MRDDKRGSQRKQKVSGLSRPPPPLLLPPPHPPQESNKRRHYMEEKQQTRDRYNGQETIVDLVSPSSSSSSTSFDEESFDNMVGQLYDNHWREWPSNIRAPDSRLDDYGRPKRNHLPAASRGGRYFSSNNNQGLAMSKPYVVCHTCGVNGGHESSFRNSYGNGGNSSYYAKCSTKLCYRCFEADHETNFCKADERSCLELQSAGRILPPVEVDLTGVRCASCRGSGHLVCSKNLLCVGYDELQSYCSWCGRRGHTVEKHARTRFGRILPNLAECEFDE